MSSIPIITFPTNSPGYSTNLSFQTIQGTTVSSTESITVNDSTEGVVYTSGNVNWTFTTMLDEGENVFSIKAVDGFGVESSPTTITITYITDDSLNLIVSAPTGITLERARDTVKISVIENPEPEIIGYNFYGSESPGGGTEGFTLLNRQLVTAHDFFKENITTLNETIETIDNIRTTYTVEKISNDYYYSYTHNRVNQPLGNKPLSEANHYVVTAVAFDQGLQQQTESIYSAELGASPLLLDTDIKDLPSRTTIDIQQSYIKDILETDRTIDVKPGTVTRDVHINPPSDEFERLYIIQDFMHRSQSFLTLLDLDDSDGDGVSDPVTEDSTYKWRLKEALLIADENADDVQVLIDDAFTKLAGNVNKKRKEAQKAIGQLLFYTRRTPTRDATISAGAIVETLSDDENDPIQFTVLTDFTLPFDSLNDYYNPSTERYEMLLEAQALEAGEAGNVDAEKIVLVVSGIDAVFGVTNPNPMEFGQDIESNSSLAQRALLSFVSVDAGTEAGYLATTLSTPNVQRAKIISAGDTLMQRDVDPLRLIHAFGKVDIYLQGNIETAYTDTFGFQFNTVKGERVLIQSADFFHFRVTNENVTYETPIYYVLEINNLTKSANYDITGFQVIGDGEVIALDDSLATNIGIGLDPTDIVHISYRYRSSEPYIFQNQPVERIISITGDDSGSLSSQNYVLQKLEDPLAFGYSTSAQDQMSLIYSSGNNLPKGSTKSIIDEPHVLTGENEVELDFYGVDTDTIVVTSADNLTTYIKDIDYTVIAGGMSTLTKIKRIASGNIISGSTILVDYNSGENFTVTYAVNTLLQDVNERIENMRHLTADVVIKAAITTYIDFEMTVVLKQGSDQTSVDRKIRTAIARLLSEKLIGQSIYQSDVVGVVENVLGVDYIVLPLSKMVKANGSLIIREALNTSWTPYQTINVTSYKSVQTLSWKTTEGGGPNTAFRGVFENDIELTLVSDLDLVAEGAGRAYISEEGYVYVSPKLGDLDNARITVTYIVQGATGARDINFCDIEYGKVGTLVITYDYNSNSQGI